MGLLSSFNDDFSTPTLDRRKWQDPISGLVTKVPEGGMKMAMPAQGVYIETISEETHDMTGSRIFMNFTELPHEDTQGGTSLILRSDSSGNNYKWLYENGTMYAQKKVAGVTTTLFTMTSVPDWWWIGELNGAVRWFTSSNGEDWDFHYSDVAPAFTDARVVVETGRWGTSAGGNTVVRFMSRTTAYKWGDPLDWLSEGFEDYPLAQMPVERSFGALWAMDDGNDLNSLRMVADPAGGKRVHVKAPAGMAQAPFFRHQMPGPLRNLDFRIDITPLTKNLSGGTYLADQEVPAIAWRIKDFQNMYRLLIHDDYMQVARIKNGVYQQLRYIGIGTKYGTKHRFRIAHVENQIVIYRSTGENPTTYNSNTPLVEIARIADDSVASAGYVGVRCYESSAYVDNMVIKEADYVDPVKHNAPMKRRKWGAFVAEGSQTTVSNPSLLEDLERAVGRKFDIASWFIDDNQTFPIAGAMDLAQGGRSNLISYGPDGWKFDDILAGVHDAYLQDFAQKVATLPTVTYIRLFPEMNGDWAPWSVPFNAVLNGVDPARDCEVRDHAHWHETWKYIVDLFVANGATRDRCKWMFCINETDEPRTNLLEDYWPGDAYVDVIGFDAYNWGTGGIHVWRPHYEVFRDAYARSVALHPTLPVWCAEFASKEPTKDDGGKGFDKIPGLSPIDPSHSKGTWVRDLMNETSFPRIEAFAWFSIDKERDWRMISSGASLRAFQKAFAGPDFPWRRAKEHLAEDLQHAVEVVATHPDYPDLPMPLQAFSIGWDETRAPRVTCTMTVPVPAQDELDMLDPRIGTRLRISLGYILPSGDKVMEEVADLGLRDRSASRPGNVITIVGASDEALVIDGSGVYKPKVSARTAPDAIKKLVESATGYEPSFFISHDDTTPATLTDYSDVWSTIDDQADRMDADVYDDGTRTWNVTERPEVSAVPDVSVKVGRGGTIVSTEANVSRDTDWANEAIVVYRWKDVGDIEREIMGRAYTTTGPYRRYGPAGRRTFLDERTVPATKEEANRTAVSLLKRRLSQGRSLTLNAIASYWVRAGHTIEVELPTGPVERHLVSSVEFNPFSGLMSVKTRVPVGATFADEEPEIPAV